MLFSYGWLIGAQEPMQAALHRIYPSKGEAAIAAVAGACLVEAEWTWAAYEAGAAAAMLDLLDFIHAHELPMPAEMTGELAFLARAALVNDGLGQRGPNKHPIGGHRAALVRRLRHAHVAAVIAEARRQQHEDTSVFPQQNLHPGAPARVHAPRPAASDVAWRAVAIARGQMPPVAGAKHVQDEALYRDFLSVLRACEAGADLPNPGNMHDPAWQRAGAWPGPYYLPTPETCAAVGWQDLADAFCQIGIGSDAPKPIVL